MSDDRDDGGDRRNFDDSKGPEELDERVAELEARLRELRAELSRPPEGPLGLPRPPTPREMLSFTGEYAIPTAIAVLEANVRALKALQQAVRILNPERSVTSEGRDRLETRAADASRATLDRLESALEDVEATVRENDLPREEEARSVLEDARRINREIRDRVERERRRADEARERAREVDREQEREGDRERASRERSDRDDAALEGGTTIEITDEGNGGDDADERDGGKSHDETDDRRGGDEMDDGPVEVDVEAELRSIKDEIEGPKGETAHSEGSRDSDSEAESAPDAARTKDTDYEDDADRGDDADSLEDGRSGDEE